MSTSDSPRMLIICGDSGGANALVQVIRQLNSDNKGKVLIFAYREAIEIMSKANFSFSVLDEKITDSGIQDLLQKCKPEIIITGTSVNYVDLEKNFIYSARKLKIPCLAVLDFWANYSQRFSDDAGQLKYVPDKIAIMDELAYSEMIAEGFNPDILIITGQPVFDTLVGCKLNFNNETRQKIRNDYHIHTNELFIVFVSQELVKFFGEDESNPQFIGYTEHSVLNNLITVLEQISQDCKKQLVLIIRPHPCEKPDKYKMFKSNFIRIIVSNHDDPRDIVMGADLVIGMNTELLVEACYLGCIVVSLQPGLRVKDFVPTNNNGYSIPIYSKEKILDTLKMTLMDPDIRSEMKKKVDRFKHDGHATNKVVNLIYQMIETRKLL